ncbi:MAG: acetyl-CoA carboxylase biotin carboxyl carrier protein subunit [SAR202 cluster bacterium]|nr:acetyl-CoA carboxylase biotin carboxyl carrier protein subunit [SAR202 cluster bacterium]
MAVVTVRVQVAGRRYTVTVEDSGGPAVTCTVDGETYVVEVPPAAPAAPPAPPPSQVTPPGQSGNLVRAPMPGRVMAIRVRPGDQVAAGDELCVVEAMKMEQSLRAARPGVVKAVLVQPLDNVKGGDSLVELG